MSEQRDFEGVTAAAPPSDSCQGAGKRQVRFPLQVRPGS